jgi:hypothetical protein
LYGCETWFLTLREEHRLRVFENRILRRIFESKTVEVTWSWKNLCEELSPNIIRVIKSREMGESCSMHVTNSYRILAEKL